MPLFGKGFRVGTGTDQDRWLIVKKLGEGQFAEVYEVKDTMDADKRYGLKIERRRDMRSVKQEFKVLKKIQERAPSLVCTVHACGTFEDRFYMIMELLGNNIAEARKAAGGRFDLATIQRLSACMLRGLEEVHAAGFVHRDVKPANFAVEPAFADALTGMWKVIDFGLARRYLDDAGDVLPERTDTSFRGSTTYASVHAHAEQDLGRRDDLWSWLYCTIELLAGTLPWRIDQNKDPDSREAVLRMKQSCIADPSRYLRMGTGAAAGGAHHPMLQHLILGPVQQLSNYIASLGFSDSPDYGVLYSCLSQLPDGLGTLLPGMCQGSMVAAAASASVQGMWLAEAHYGQQQQQQQAAAAAQMMYHQQYFGLPHPHHHPQVPPGAATAGGGSSAGVGGFLPSRGSWGNQAIFAQQQPHPHQGPHHSHHSQQHHQHHQQQQHHHHLQQHQQQQQLSQRYPSGGPPPPPDPGRSSPHLLIAGLDTPTSPRGELGTCGGSGGGGQDQPPPPPLPPPPPGEAQIAGVSSAVVVGPGTVEMAPCVEVSVEVAEAMLAEALAERSGADPPGREAAQVAEVHEYVELIKQGHVSDEAHDVAGRLMRLEPVEALAAISYVLDALAAHTAPSTANTVAVALSALGSYARDAAKRAMTKYCRVLAAQHKAQQPQQLHQQRGPGRGAGGGS